MTPTLGWSVMTETTEPMGGADRAGCQVVVRRDGRGWLADTAALGVIRARTLHTLLQRVGELVGPEPVDYQFYTGDAELDRLVIQIRAARAAARRLDERARRLTGRVLLLPSGGSVRDLAL